MKFESRVEKQIGIKFTKSIVPCSISCSWKDGIPACKLKNCFFILVNLVLISGKKLLNFH